MNRSAEPSLPAQQPVYAVLGDRVTLKSSSASGAWELFEIEATGNGPPPHIHDWDEVYYVLDGRLEVQLGNQVATYMSGAAIGIAAGVAHCFRPVGVGPARFLAFVAPGGAAAFFATLDRAAKAGPPDLRQIMDIARRFGVHPAPMGGT